MPQDNILPTDGSGPIQDSQNVIQSTVDPTAAEDVKLVMSLFEQGKQYRKKYDADWTKRQEMYKDNQWEPKKAAYRSSPTLNVVRIAIQSMIPLLTDNRPGFNVAPEEPGDYAFANDLGEVIEAWWQKRSMDHSVVECLMDQSILDCGIFKVTWCEDEDQGAGDVKCEVISPFDVYVSPKSRDFTRDKGCKWVIHKIEKTVGELKMAFPKFADQITADTNNTDDEQQKDLNTVNLVSPIDKDTGMNLATPPSGSQDTRKIATILECWIFDDAVVEYEEEQADGTKNKKFKKQYPNGKLMTILPGKKLRLQVSENPYKHGMFPFVRMVDAILPREFYGEGEVASLMGMQRIINRLLANILDYSNIFANPVWKTEDGNGVDPTRLTNQTGLIIRTRAGAINTVQRDVVPAMQSGILDLMAWMLRQVEMITGSSEVSQGRRPAGVTAAAAIENLQEAAQTRVRLKERNMNASLSQLGFQISALIMQYYTEPRVIRITGKDQGSWPDYFDFFVEHKEDGTVVANKRKYIKDEENKTYTPSEQFTQSAPSKGVFDVKVMSGSNLPWQKAQRSNLAFKLFEGQAIDQEELLTALDWPNSEKIIERMKQPPAGGQPPIPGAP